jgi:hypothetical protein
LAQKEKMYKITLLLFLSISLIGFTQKQDLDKVDLKELIRETQRQLGEDQQMHFYWWLPTEYWEVALSQDPTVSKADLKAFIEPLSDYTMLMVIRGKFGVFGNVTYASRDSIMKDLVMIDQDKKEYKPIPEDDLNMETASILAVFKPMMSNMLGQMGSHLEFFVFENKAKKGKEIFSPYSSNTVKARCLGELVEWRTPLGSLYKKRKCPVDQEEFKGTWDYCPYHGDKLE